MTLMRSMQGALSYQDIMNLPTRAYKAMMAELGDEAHEAELARRRAEAERVLSQKMKDL